MGGAASYGVCAVFEEERINFSVVTLCDSGEAASGATKLFIAAAGPSELANILQLKSTNLGPCDP